MIKALLLSAIFCVTSCGDQLAQAVTPDEDKVETSAAGGDAVTKEPEKKPEIVFKSGTGNPGSEAKKPKPNLPQADWIIVDKSDRMLVLYRDGKELKRYKNIRFGDVPAGHKQFQGDEKTPEGDYYIDGRNPGSKYHLSLRISYPNKADRSFAAKQGRSPGGDIFIHGQPNGYKGPTLSHDWTDGCIAVSDAEIREIWQMVPNGAQIRIQQ